MNILSSMKIFQQIVELNSFVLASEKLNISPAMVSKHIKSLEEYLGVRLLNRTSRKLSLTNEGKIYFERCTDILNDIEQIESILRCNAVVPRGTLKISVPSWFYFNRFNNAINDYCKKYPEVLIEIFSNDRLVDLVEEGIDLALRVTDEPSLNLIAKRMNEVKFFIVGSHEYFNIHAKPKNILELSNHKFIITNHIKNNDIIVYKEKEQIKEVKLKTLITTNNTIMASYFALSGIGLTILPEYILNQNEFKNKLEIVLPEIDLPKKYLFTVYSSRKFLSPKVRTFIDFISDYFKDNSY